MARARARIATAAALRSSVVTGTISRRGTSPRTAAAPTAARLAPACSTPGTGRGAGVASPSGCKPLPMLDIDGHVAQAVQPQTGTTRKIRLVHPGPAPAL